MKSIKVWGPITIAAALLVSVFQNCSPVAFKEAENGVLTQSSAKAEKACELEKRKAGETWMSAAGQSRELIACTVGSGNQFNVFDIAKEYRCEDGTAVPTGKEEKHPAGLDGLCNVDCGSHKNGELWMTELGTSIETLQCATSTTATSSVKYQNLAEYSCVDAVASATGKTEKRKLEETACPALTFNDEDNQATLAFEDIYPKPLDSDYNDFVTNIKVQETYSSLGELNKIVIDYTPSHIGGGLPHKLITIFDGTVRGRDGWVSNQNIFKSEPMFVGAATIKYELLKDGSVVSSSMPAKNQDLVVFEHTKTAVESKLSARITITGIDGKQNLLSVRKGLSIKRYRSLLYVPDSGNYSNVKRYDIDISDINPSSYDDAGRPLAFFVPVNWRSPKEGMSILSAYPDFQAHSDYLKASIANPGPAEPETAKKWFENAVLGNVN